MNNKGTTQWTMSKLITMILAVFLLVLIIYGVQSKGFGPLKENIQGRYNEVLIFLGFRDDGTVTCGDAFPQGIDGVGSGMFYPCENNCSFIPDSGVLDGVGDGFSITEDGFFALYNGHWISDSSSLLDRDLSYERDFYEGAIGFMLNEFGHSLEDEKALGFFNKFVLCDYFCLSPKDVIFFGESDDLMKGMLTYDGENFLVEEDEKVRYSGTDINEAVDKFHEMVDNVIDWSITYSINSSKVSDLSKLGGIFDDNELDSDGEAKALKGLFKKWGEERSGVSDTNVDILRGKFGGKTLVLGNGDSYDVSVDFKNKLFPYLVFTSGSRKFALGYISTSKTYVWRRVDWIPLGLYEERGGSWVFVEGNRFYKLDLQEYEDIVKINKVYEYFKLRRCGNE